MFPKAMIRISTSAIVLICLFVFHKDTLVSARTYVRTRRPGLTSVRFIDNQYGWIAGTQGVFYTDDGGWSWRRQKLVVAKEFGRSRAALVEKSGKILWADKESALVRTDNSLAIGNGKAGPWRLVKCQTSPQLLDIAFPERDLGWAISDRGIYFSRDGGSSWELKRKSSEGLQSLCAVSAKAVWVIGFRRLMISTTDQGESWHEYLFQDREPFYLRSVKFIDQKRGWAFKSNGPLFSSDGGVTWGAYGPPDMKATELFDVAFGNENVGWIVGDGTIFYTENGGRNWEIKVRNIKDYMVSISPLPNGNSWAVGAGGTVMKTSDTGKAWEYWDLRWNFRPLKGPGR